MSLTASAAEYNVYSATQNETSVLVIQRVSDSLCVITPDNGYSTGRIIDNYVRNVDALTFTELSSDITGALWQASFNSVSE